LHRFLPINLGKKEFIKTINSSKATQLIIY